jgi:hypothetical protein
VIPGRKEAAAASTQDRHPSNREVAQKTRHMSTRAKAELIWILRPDMRPRIEGGLVRVPSLTIGNLCHTVTDDGTCSCEAGRRGCHCWHVDAAEIAYERYGVPACDWPQLRYWTYEAGRVVRRVDVD